MKRFFILCFLSILLSPSLSAQQRQQAAQRLETHRMENAHWKVGYTANGINSLESVKDPYQANLLSGELGDVMLVYKVKDGVWMRTNTSYNRFNPVREMKANAQTGTVSYKDVGMGNFVEMTQTFRLDGEVLHWNIDIANNSKYPIEVGDLSITFPLQSGRGGSDRNSVFEKNYNRHSYVSGDASFLYFTRVNGEAPYFLLTVDPGTKLEFSDNSRLFIHSGKTGRDDTRGTWRQEHTSGWLQPAGSGKDKLSFGFTLHISDTYQQMKEQIVASRSVNVEVAPGMTVPITQKAKFALNTLCSIESVVAEFPATTTIQYLEKKGANTHIYEVEFKKLGENLLTVHFDGGRKTYLEFYCCESPEIITKKRSSFLVNSQQHREPSKWYNGLFGVYDMVKGELLGPDNPQMFDDTRNYYIGSDDPVLGKAPFLASKNAVFPNDKEIASLEYYLKHFVWGGMQRTDKETPYPYGVYGTPNWYINRDTVLRKHYTAYSLDKLRLWRTFDYAHVAMLWWHMYQIAKFYPEKCTFMTADQYLEAAYRTAKAFYVYPVELDGGYYEPFKWGCYNELLTVDIIDELEARGLKAKAADLRAEWEKKAKWFIYDEPYPYSSEYVTDRTAFESSYFLAKYGVLNDMKPDTNLWFDPNANKWYSHPVVTKAAARDFMERQLYAALACRSTLETQWFKLGGDNSFSYMARMGSSAILDYGYRFAEDPYEWLRLGYAGHIGPFGLVNTGTPETNYGFWFPGKDKDGALGQNFISSKVGRNWGGTDELRGPSRYCGEGDLGLCAITRTAVTMLVNDPIFGWTAFGGNLTEDTSRFSVYSDDGARIRFRIVNDNIRVGLELDRDNISGTQPVIVNKDLKSMELKLENGSGNKHTTRITVDMKGASNPRLTADGKNISSKRDRYGNWIFDVPVEKSEALLKMTWR